MCVIMLSSLVVMVGLFRKLLTVSLILFCVLEWRIASLVRASSVSVWSWVMAVVVS